MKEKKIMNAVAMSLLLVILSFSTFLPQVTAAKPPPPSTVTITSPNPVTYGFYGLSVATNGAYVVVGAYSENSGSYTGAGNAYIYGTNGTLLETLTSQNPQSSGGFGHSVAVGGGYVVVGAPFETSGGYSVGGNVYIFKTNGTYVRTLTSTSPESPGAFGFSVAIAGGYIVVGAPYESSYAGNAYIFFTNGTSVAKISTQNPANPGYFGTAVATDGSTVVAGAPSESSNSTSNAGNAYIFKMDGTLLKTLTSPKPENGGYFGTSVAVDGREVIVAADSEYSGGQYDAGHVYIFTGGKLFKTLSSPNAEYTGYFGSSLAIDGRQLVIGGYHESSGSFDSAGNAYVYTTSGKLVSTLTSPNTQTGGFFGFSVATFGSYAVVGAYGESSGSNSHVGNAYIFPLR